MSRARSWALALGIALAIGTSAQASHAQSDDEKRSAARGFANDGLDALNGADYARAIDLFSRAEALVHAPPHLLYIARASAAMGKLVQADEAYLKIAREELDPTAPKAFLDAQIAAAQEQAALGPRIPKLTIVVHGQAANDATVMMDGAAVPSALVGVAYPANPGAHTLSAAAPGFASAEVVVELSEGAAQTATLELSPSPDPTAIRLADPVVGSDESPSTAKRALPWVVLGVGVAGLGAGTFFVAQNRSKRDEADAVCGNGPCASGHRAEIESLDGDADQAATFAWVGYALGAVGVVTGATLLVLASRSSSSSPSSTTGAHVRPWVSAGSAGLEGRF